MALNIGWIGASRCTFLGDRAGSNMPPEEPSILTLALTEAPMLPCLCGVEILVYARLVTLADVVAYLVRQREASHDR